jgi:hypothetical protein
LNSGSIVRLAEMRNLPEVAFDVHRPVLTQLFGNGGLRGFDGLELGRLHDVLRGSRPKNPSRVRVNHQPGQFQTGLRFVAVMARRFHGALPFLFVLS